MRRLIELIKVLDFEVVVSDSTPETGASDKFIPIIYATAKKADALALAGIWKHNPKNVEDIRQNAWGDFEIFTYKCE